MRKVFLTAVLGLSVLMTMAQTRAGGSSSSKTPAGSAFALSDGSTVTKNGKALTTSSSDYNVVQVTNGTLTLTDVSLNVASNKLMTVEYYKRGENSTGHLVLRTTKDNWAYTGDVDADELNNLAVTVGTNVTWNGAADANNNAKSAAVTVDNAAKNEALFLSDKMAYELNLTDAQYDAVYEINLDYLMSVNGHNDVFGTWWDRRNADLRYVLNSWQYDKYVALKHFYRPVAWKAGSWTFAMYSHYNRGHFYNARPTAFVTYKGGNNRKADCFYADRKVTKPAVHVAKNVPAKVNKSSNGSTWRDTGSNSRPATTTKTNGHSNGNRQIAMNTNNNRSGSGHFGGRR